MIVQWTNKLGFQDIFVCTSGSFYRKKISFVCTMYSVSKKKHVGYEQKQAGEPPPWEMKIHNTKIIIYH